MYFVRDGSHFVILGPLALDPHRQIRLKFPNTLITAMYVEYHGQMRHTCAGDAPPYNTSTDEAIKGSEYLVPIAEADLKAEKHTCFWVRGLPPSAWYPP